MPINVTQRNPPLINPTYPVYQYTGLLTQEGTDHPTYSIMKNTLGQPTISRVSIGVYRITLPGAFPNNLTYISITQNVINGFFLIARISDDIIEITSMDQSGGSQTDELLSATPFQILVYTPIGN